MERNITAAQVASGTLSAARIPDLDAAKITTGELATARYPRRTIFAGSQGVLAANTASGRHTPLTCGVVQSTASAASAALVALWQPFFIPRSTAVTLTISCTTLQAGATARMAIFSGNEATYAPVTLLEDLGTVSMASTGNKQLTSASAHSGFVWVGIWSSNHTSVRFTRPTVDTSAANGFGTPGSTSSRVPYGWFATGVDYSASWPAGSPPALTVANNTDQVNYPAVWMEWA